MRRIISDLRQVQVSADFCCLCSRQASSLIYVVAHKKVSPTFLLLRC